MPEITINSVSLAFGSGAARVEALKDLSIVFNPGILHVISGRSGSGKTSLLSILGALLDPDAGSVHIEGADIFAMSPEQRTSFRRTHIGYVFQSFRLMRALTASENVLLSLEVRRTPEAENCCRESLGVVGLQSKAHLSPDQMSGGEQQRVAIARAIAHRPSIVLADEPTANLDAANGQNIARLLQQIARNPGRVVIVVSHDPRVFPFADRMIQMEDGRIVGDELCRSAR